MSYTKTTWSDGDIITANKMNNIETGVESLNTDVWQLQTDLDSLTETVENLPTGGGDVPADYQELVDDVSQIKADLSKYVRFDTAQDKTAEEKAQARANIGIEDSEIYAENVIAEYETVTEPPKTYSDITRQITATSTVSGKSWDGYTNTASDAANYSYSRYDNISVYKKAYISGKPGLVGTLRTLGAFYDSNGNNVGVVSFSHSWGIDNHLIDIPATASYLIVNGCVDSTRDNHEAVFALLNNQTLGVMIEFDGSRAEGAQKTDGSITAGANYYHVRYNSIPDTEYMYVTGVSWSTDWPLVIYYNANGDVVGVLSAQNSTLYNMIEVSISSIPQSTSYFIINASTDERNPNAGVFYPSTSKEKVPTKTQKEFNIEVASYLSKKYLIIGDSYGAGYSHDGNNNGWCNYLVDYMNLDTSSYKILTNSGSGFSGNDFATVINSETETGFTDVVVCAGYNDYSFTRTEILSGILAFKNTVALKWPNAKIHIGFIAYIKAGTGTGAESSWQNIRNALVNIVLPAYQDAVTLGCDYLNNVEYWIGESGLTPSDGYHPSAEGNQSIAKAIANAILTGSAPLPYNADLRVQ